MPFIPIIIAYLKRNAIPVICAGLIVLIVVLVFNHWTESLIESGRREVRQQWTERDADMARKTDELIKRKAREAEVINQLNHEKANHVIQLYTKHYNDLRRAADAAPKRLYIHTKTASCSGNTVPGSGWRSIGIWSRICGNH